MKEIIKYFNLILLAAITLGCDSDDKTVDVILDTFTSGGVLRTIDIDNNMVYNDLTMQFDNDANYTLTLEEQDNQNGGLLSEVEIYTRFIENTRVDTNNDGKIDDKDDDLSTEEGLIRTLTASDFQTGERGVPTSVITFTAAELVSFTGVNESLIQGSDDFELRFILKLTDGRTFSVDDANGNVSGGSYFSSPYTYRTTVKCAITESLADTYTYQITELISAPGGRSNCPSTLTGQVTWEETDTPGEYTTTDISFGQFDSCYNGIFKEITFDEIKITWDCIELVAEGTIETVEEGSDKEEEFTYTYTITETSGSDITIEFGNSAGDRGTVILTRPNGKVWPTLLTR
ncbi:hypothetical protein U6A24_05415 [Aquimarina gracilis]|uniref:Uncharacterized protein n=1 Tax=Aquimarina gracilis TaxID=874422 RepID=A0ABU5ZU22_9FLAO|nr:hypothetical protein [Aquimarina gracilis]MEB3344887.1 hypothetical protein [Aquimarina gracilis]